MIDAALGEILTTCSKMDWLLDHGEAALRPEIRHSNMILSYKKSMVYHEPLGVVAAIVSWNYRSYKLCCHQIRSDWPAYSSATQRMVTNPRIDLRG